MNLLPDLLTEYKTEYDSEDEWQRLGVVIDTFIKELDILGTFADNFVKVQEP